MASKLRLEPAPDRPWLSIVGIGEDGLAGLGSDARRHIAEAEFVFGGKRHLGLAADLIKGEQRQWPSPFDAAMRDLTSLRGRRVCVLASGDPFLHGVGATIARLVPADGNDDLPGALRLQPGGRPARLAAGRDRDRVAARQAGRTAAPAAASRTPGDRADIRRERPGGGRRTARGQRVRRFDDHGAGGAGRNPRTHPRDPRRPLRARTDRSAQRRGDRRRSSARRAHPAADAGPQRRCVRA